VALAAVLVASPISAVAESRGVAVFPPVNRTGRAVPADEIQAAVEASLARHGFAPLDPQSLERFFEKHRVRYVGGVSGDLAASLGSETGVDGVLLVSVDDWDPVDPPRVGLTARWPAATPTAPVAWMASTARQGGEHPGAFDRGVVSDPSVLLGQASEELVAALAEFRTGTTVRDPGRVPRPFRPRNLAVDPAWADGTATGRPIRVAVLPFLTDTRDREIGDVVASQIVRRLLDVDGLDVLEPGVVRAALLESRVIQDDGPSLSQVDALRAVLDVDLVVSGRVTDFEPLGTAPGSPFLGFSVRGIDAPTRQVVFSSFSFGRGDDRIGPFGTLRIRSPLTLTSELVRGVIDALHDELRVRRPPAGATATKEPPR
jgi:hypothetical protein